MTGVSAVVKGKTMKIFINEKCYVLFQLRGKIRMRLVKFKKCFIMDFIRIYMIKTKGLQKYSNSDILWTASIGWRFITVHTSLIYFVWLEYQVWVIFLYEISLLLSRVEAKYFFIKTSCGFPRDLVEKCCAWLVPGYEGLFSFIMKNDLSHAGERKRSTNCISY